MRPTIVFALSLLACAGAEAQSPGVPEIQRIQSPACAKAPEQTGDAAAMSGCYRVWAPNFAALKSDEERAAAMREWQRVNALWQTAQVLGRGHYAVRQATKEELDALAKIGPPAPSGVSAAGGPSMASGGLAAGPWQGSGSKDTETFAIGANEWRVVWMATSTSRVGGVLNITVHSADGRMITNISSGDVKGQAKDVSYVRAPAGRYYLSISSANAQWVVGVEGR